jgi:hypothetical protein
MQMMEVQEIECQGQPIRASPREQLGNREGKRGEATEVGKECNF